MNAKGQLFDVVGGGFVFLYCTIDNVVDLDTFDENFTDDVDLKTSCNHG